MSGSRVEKLSLLDNAEHIDTQNSADLSIDLLSALPREILTHILIHTSLQDLAHVAATSREMRNVVDQVPVELRYTLPADSEDEEAVARVKSVKGTYADLLPLIGGHHAREERLEELNKTCCIDHDIHCDNKVSINCFFSGLSAAGLCSLTTTIASYAAHTTLPAWGLFTILGEYWGISSLALHCVTSRIASNQEERARLVEYMQNGPETVGESIRMNDSDDSADNSASLLRVKMN